MNWDGHCRSVALAFVDKAKPLLTERQLEDLKAAIKSELGGSE